MQRLSVLIPEQLKVAHIDSKDRRNSFSVGQMDQACVGKINALIAILGQDATDLGHSADVMVSNS